MNLTEHFTYAELVASQTASKLGINNTPTPSANTNLQILANGLEQIRVLLNAPMLISSGYRCVELNKAVGGVPDSAHIQGYAADFTAPQFGDPLAIVNFLKDTDLVFDQIIQEGTWVHVSFAPTMRREVLTAHFNGTHATYTEGS